MVALNNNWIEVARVHKNVNGGMYDVVLWAREPDQWIDVENNKSWIEVSLDTEWIQGNTYGGNYLIECTGCTPISGGSPYHFETSKNILRGGFWAGHDDNGDYITNLSASLTFGAYPLMDTSLSGDVSCRNIPRKSVVDNYSLNNNENKYSITYTRKVNAYRERMRISIVNVEQIKVVQPYVSGSVVSMSESEWDRIYELTKNLDKGKCEIGIVLETWTADFKTKIGESAEYKQELTITDSPTLDSIVVTDEGIAKTYIPNEYECMSLLSKKRIKVTANAKKHATIKSIIVSVGTFNKTVNTSTTDVLFDGLTNASGEITYTITATDSRNNVTTWTKKAKYHQYVRPSIINLNVARNGAESSNGAISADGEYWQGKVGNTTNAINITITGSATGSTTGILNANKWSATKPIGGANPNQAYTYTLIATDRFGQSISRDITLAIEKALMQLGKTQVDVNGNFCAEAFYLKNNNTYQRLIDFFYPVGAIIMNENKDYDPNIILGGTWEKINDRFLIGASKDIPIKSQGGSATHTHGDRDGRNGNLAAAIGATNNNANVIGYKAANDTNLAAIGNATYVVAGSGVGYTGWNHFTAVVGQTAEDGTLPPYYAVNIWRRVK